MIHAIVQRNSWQEPRYYFT